MYLYYLILFDPLWIKKLFCTCLLLKIKLLKSTDFMIWTSYHIYSKQCFFQKPVPYEICRLLLRSSSSCGALTYTNSACSLHNRSEAIQIPVSANNFNGYIVVRLDQKLDSCDLSPIGLQTNEVIRQAGCLYIQCMRLITERSLKIVN